MTLQLSGGVTLSLMLMYDTRKGRGPLRGSSASTLQRPLGGMIPLGHLRLTSCLRAAEEVNRVLTQVTRSTFACLISPLGDQENRRVES